MFEFRLEPEISLLTVIRSGSWSVQTVADYEAVLRRQLIELNRSGPSTSFIIDIRSTSAHSRQVADALRAMIGRLGPLNAQRTAVVASSGIAKLQARRVANAGAEVFTSMTTARNWVMHRSPAETSNEMVFDEPSDAEAEKHNVHIHGPSDIDISLTPRAALETAKRIGDAAIEVLLENAVVSTFPKAAPA